MAMKERESQAVLAAPTDIETWVRRALRERREAGAMLMERRVLFADPRLEGVAEDVRAREADPEVALQKFLEDAGLVEPPGIALETQVVDLGTVPRAERRPAVFRLHAVGLGILYGDAIPIGPLARAVRPLRARYRGSAVAVEFMVFSEELPMGGPHEIPIRFRTNAGVVEGRLRLVVAPRPARVRLEPADIEVVAESDDPAGGCVRMRNLGDVPVSVRWNAAVSWVRVEGPAVLAAGGEEEWKVVVDVAAARRDAPKRWYKGDWCAGADLTVAVETPDGVAESRTCRLRAWRLRRWDFTSLWFGLATGIVPFINLLVFCVVGVDALRRGRKLSGGYRERCERRDNLSFLTGMLPTLGLHLWLLMSRM
jgi:hypothetical protein